MQRGKVGGWIISARSQCVGSIIFIVIFLIVAEIKAKSFLKQNLLIFGVNTFQFNKTKIIVKAQAFAIDSQLSSALPLCISSKIATFYMKLRNQFHSQKVKCIHPSVHLPFKTREIVTPLFCV